MAQGTKDEDVAGDESGKQIVVIDLVDIMKGIWKENHPHKQIPWTQGNFPAFVSDHDPIKLNFFADHDTD